MVKKSSKNKNPTEKIIGRLREKDLLNDLISSKKSEFIAVYGRRRVGKTYLIKNFASSLPCIFFHVTGLQNSNSKEQQEEFSKQIGITFYNGASMAQRE
ncbi:MAG: hypothetical protein ACOVOR_02200 [Rhabdochlamydiaceae bacterium]